MRGEGENRRRKAALSNSSSIETKQVAIEILSFNTNPRSWGFT